jgi:hypothetical protein
MSEPMPNDRPWYREPETFIALAALVVSLSAVVVGMYEAALQRAHDRAEVWPHVEMATFTTATGASVYLQNNGIGPAIIEMITVSVDGRPRRDWTDVLQALLGKAPGGFSTSDVLNRGVRAGDKIELIAVTPQQLPPDFWHAIRRVTIEVCYRSVFNDRWELSANLGKATTAWHEVDRCPAQPAGTDF